jgi:hypothetical protein
MLVVAVAFLRKVKRTRANRAIFPGCVALPKESAETNLRETPVDKWIIRNKNLTDKK